MEASGVLVVDDSDSRQSGEFEWLWQHDAVMRCADDIDQMYQELVDEFYAPAPPPPTQPTASKPDGGCRTEAFGHGPADREIAYNMAKGIFVLHHTFGTSVESLHTLLSPFNLARCSYPGCKCRTAGVSFFCDWHRLNCPMCASANSRESVLCYLAAIANGRTEAQQQQGPQHK